MKLRELTTGGDGFDQQLAKLLNRDSESSSNTDAVDAQVRDIIQAVRERGNAALIDYTAKFDRYAVQDFAQLELSQERLQQAVQSIDADKREALETAAERIRRFHQRQLQGSWDYQDPDGTRLGQKVSPMYRAGLYVPGGKAAYPSSVMMTAIPAKVAGVQELVMMAPTPSGELNETVLAAACLAGVDRVFTLGGAQAIAALAYGTETVPAVDTIVGPGNIYVATAKKLVFGQVGIDMIAGPSEVLIVADASADPEWVAMDLFAQAEHDEMAQSILLTADAEFASKVQQAVERLLPTLPRKDIIEQSLNNNGAIILADTSEFLALIDEIAPEHLELMVEGAETLAEQVRNAGAIFIGAHSSESLGDYIAGPSHVLPTSGTARFSSPLGVYDFQKRTSIIHCSAAAAGALGKPAAVIARSESLDAHARSAEMRVTDQPQKS